MLSVVKAGGEGLMARKPRSRYAAGRHSARLLKFKPAGIQMMQGGRPINCDF
jgi:ATP-dependent DNA ligase